jgi:predicted phage baseplate assembly protein
MVLPLPDLDTGRFPDLADEARNAIPRVAPSWTDHNLSDPGITLTELIAAEVDRLMYRVNRITDRDRRTLLRLIGFAPMPPIPAVGVVSFRLANAAAPRKLPAGLVLLARDVSGGAVPLVVREPVRVGSASCVAIMTGDVDGTRDASPTLASGGMVEALGDDPAPARSSALYLGFDLAPEVGQLLDLILVFDADDSPPVTPSTAADNPTVAWEYFDGAIWTRLTAADGTAALSRSGRVRLSIDQPIPSTTLAPNPTALAWIRCRLVSGRPDKAPVLSGIAVHAAAVEQASAALTRFSIGRGVSAPPGRAPVPGTSPPLALTFDADRVLTSLAAGPPLDTPDVAVLEATPTAILATAVPLGTGDRTPHQILWLPGAPVIAATVSAWVVRTTAAGLVGETVRLVPGLDATGPHDTVAVLDAAIGRLTFGDGRRGRMLAPDEYVLARYEHTLGRSGNLRAASPCRIDTNPEGPNNALLGTSSGVADADITALLPWAISGGMDAEDVEHAAGRAARRLSAHERLLELLPNDGPATLDGLERGAVMACDAPERGLTGADLERIVLSTPGRRIARCRVFPEMEPTLPSVRAAGTATVVVVPFLPKDRPEPTESLLGAVRANVEARRIVGSRILVAGPTYVEVTVRATLDLEVAADATVTLAAARAAVDEFLHPLTGGPLGRGWPFGRDVYRADVLAVLDDIAGVASVGSLDLVDAAGHITCGNLCVPPTALVASGAHDIRSVSA